MRTRISPWIPSSATRWLVISALLPRPPAAPPALTARSAPSVLVVSVMTVPVDVQPHSRNPINLRSNAPVEAAILGQRLFDVRQVDPARRCGWQVRTPSPRGNGGASAQIKDVNQDGTADPSPGLRLTRPAHRGER